MLDYKTVFGYLAGILIIAGYVPYFISIFKNKTKPHAFSWFVWGLLLGTAGWVQYAEGAGIGSLGTLLGSLACLSVFVLALIKGDRKFSRFDWIMLTTSLGTFVLWRITKEATLAAVLVTLTDAFGFIPTYRKGFLRPFEENLGPYFLGAVATFFGLLSIEQYSVATWLYPASLMVTDTTFGTMLLIRRRSTATRKAG